MVCVFSTTAAPDLPALGLVRRGGRYGQRLLGFSYPSRDQRTRDQTCPRRAGRPHGSARKLKCSVAFASAERDLALLEVIDDAMSPPVLNFAQSLPELYSAVAVVGYPLGGDNICVTRGVVSRLDAMAYGGEGRGERLLVVQIDAGVNSGTSGGPALDERGHVAGVAFSSYAGSADNIGYLVPASVVEAFLPV